MRKTFVDAFIMFNLERGGGKGACHMQHHGHAVVLMVINGIAVKLAWVND